ncbi:hypothetical protein J4558_27215 [Leptolyngbya sp. 15MV]|nr:hypothetical protein J4558_27215 [Leptolyngbya sp. 15MV]
MPVDRRAEEHFRNAMKANQGGHSALDGGSGDGQPPGMDTELALLKQRADQTDKRLERIEGKLDRITDILGGVATKEDVREASGDGAV